MLLSSLWWPPCRPLKGDGSWLDFLRRIVFFMDQNVLVFHLLLSPQFFGDIIYAGVAVERD